MDKMTNKLGLISLSVIFIAFFLKINHLPGANILLLMSLGGAVPFFIVLYGIGSIKTGMNVIFLIFGGFSLVQLSVGSLFKILHWPGANIIFYAGFAILLILLLIFSISSSSKKENTESALQASDYLILTVLVLVIGIQGMATRSADVVDFDRTFIETQTKNRQAVSDFEVLLPEMETDTKAIVDQFIKESVGIVETIDSIKMNLLQASGVDEISQLDAKQLENKNIVGQVFILQQESNRLKAALDKHRQLIADHDSIFMLAEQANVLLNTDDHIVPEYGEIIPWEYYMFDHKNLTSAFIILNEMESDVLLLRYMALSNIKK